jgi:sulfonate transport system substrate-binding protein
MRAESRRTFRIGGVPEHFNLPWQMAIGSERLAEAGLAIDWTDFATGTGAMLAELADGGLDAAILLTEGAALGIARGAPIEAVSLYTTTPLIWGVHVPSNSDAGSLADLDGGRFALSRPGSGSHLMSLALAMAQGWPVDSLAFVTVDDLPGAIRAFADGRADAFLWEHFTTAPAVEAGLLRRVDDFIAPWPAWVVCVATAVWQEERADFEQLYECVLDRARALAGDPERTALIAGRYGLREDAVEEWLARTAWVGAFVSPRPALAEATAMLAAAGAIAR